MKIPFTKCHANGNDFILILSEDFPDIDAKESLIQRLCNRNTGIGADGLFIILSSKKYDFFLDYYNSDGSWETLCANGSRCASKFIYSLDNTKQNLKFETGAGVHTAEIKSNSDVLMSMKTPVYKSECLSPEGIPGVFVDSGARHFVCQSDNLDEEHVLTLGRKIRYSQPFKPQGINVNFYRIQSDNIIEIRTYEKGVERLVLSCSSGSSAVAYHLSKSHGLISPITTSSIGGSLKFAFDEGWREAFCEGPAELLFSGEF
jgi:diaminopimelate epimerase